MKYEALLNLVDIESPDEFEYFENFAAIIEADEDIGEEELFLLFKDVDKDVLLNILDEYFEDLQDSIPDVSTDFFTFLETLKMALKGLLLVASGERSIAGDYEEEEDAAEYALGHFAEEVARFKEWFCREDAVECQEIKTGKILNVSVCEAVALSKLENLDGSKHRYDFDKCMDYDLDEYVMNFADLAKEDMDDR